MSHSSQSAETSLSSQQVLWRCLDTDGVDTCRFWRGPEGWNLIGTAIFHHDNRIARIDYRVGFDDGWKSRSAKVTGTFGELPIDLFIERSSDRHWMLDGTPIDEVDGLVDVDLGFTPATNTNAIKRLDLSVGQQSDTTAVWLDINDWSFKPLRQTYRRNSQNAYVYISPDNDYQTELEVDDFGIVRRYPDLWQAV